MNTLSEEISLRMKAAPMNVNPVVSLIRITVEVTREYERADPASVEAFLQETKPGEQH